MAADLTLMLGNNRWMSTALAAALVTMGLGLSAGASAEGDFLAKINAERSSRGLNTLSVDGGLASHARNHTQDMINAGGIYHSSEAELKAAAGSGWSSIGENVGRGGSVSSLHKAFMDSPGHRANILGDYNYAGIGTGTSNGVLYVTVVFMKKGSTTTTAPPTTAAPTTAPPATSPPTTAKATSSAPGTKAPAKPATTAAPTTTLPPTTTTTSLIVGPDKPVTPGESCLAATRFWWMCHD
ncbi:MAG: CAP domain-containing protein [Acidimicrobiia bacterium]